MPRSRSCWIFCFSLSTLSWYPWSFCFCFIAYSFLFASLNSSIEHTYVKYHHHFLWRQTYQLPASPSFLLLVPWGPSKLFLPSPSPIDWVYPSASAFSITDVSDSNHIDIRPLRSPSLSLVLLSVALPRPLLLLIVVAARQWSNPTILQTRHSSAVHRAL